MLNAQQLKYLVLVFTCTLLGACDNKLPEGVKPVNDFDVQRYMGKWYEVARLDNRFERGLVNVTAEYSLNNDNTVRVINSGVDEISGEKKVAEGKAKFVHAADIGFLKVSFFGPFYGSYGIFELGKNYEYAFVSGDDNDYLWLLAREPELSDELITHFIQKSSALGFELDTLVFPQQSATPQLIPDQ